MTQIATKTRYIIGIDAVDANTDALRLSDTQPGQPNMSPMGGQDTIHVAKPHSHQTGEAITVDYSV